MSTSNAQLLAFLSGWPRRVVAGLCLFAAALLFVTGAHRKQASTPVVVASHALTAGVALQVADLRLVRWPEGPPPPATARSPDQLVGHRTATAIPAGMPVGAAELMEPALAQALSTGRVAVTIRLANADELAVVRAGSYVDLYAIDADSSDLIEGKSIGTDRGSIAGASGVLVLSVLANNGQGSGNTNPTLVIAVDKATAAKLSSHAAAMFVATLVQPP